MIDVSIIIVNYNVASLLDSCLDSIYRCHSSLEIEILVVDNDSEDHSVDMIRTKYPMVRVVECSTNIGYAAANNIALKTASGNYILLLNPDTVIPRGSLDELLKYMNQHPRVGMITPRLVRDDGSIDLACHRAFPRRSDFVFRLLELTWLFPKSRLFGHYNMTYLDLSSPHEVECIAGAFMLTRREAFEHVGLLDERFFMYFEDVDWCYRFINKGWRIYYYPQIEVLHYKRSSSKKKPYRSTIEFYRGIYRGYTKYYGGILDEWWNVIVAILLWIRLVYSLLSLVMRDISQLRLLGTSG